MTNGRSIIGSLLSVPLAQLVKVLNRTAGLPQCGDDLCLVGVNSFGVHQPPLARSAVAKH